MRRTHRPETPEGAAHSNHVRFLFGLICEHCAAVGEELEDNWTIADRKLRNEAIWSTSLAETKPLVALDDHHV
jgi:hypothetical protein